ncbi:MAG: hypothetical protein ACYCXO_11580 [Candidatus Humimicrobiaceae bacterium]
MDKRFNHENNVTYVVTNVKNYFLNWIVMMNDEWITRSSRAMTVNKIRVKYFPDPEMEAQESVLKLVFLLRACSRTAKN